MGCSNAHDSAPQPRSRFENRFSARDCYRLAAALGEVYLRERERDGVPSHILLDLDSTDDPMHGEQEGRAYPRYYRQHMLVTNARLLALAAPLAEAAQAASDQAGCGNVRLVGETLYQAGSWEHPRRVIIKAEVLAPGPNLRFVVTTRTEAPEPLYDAYVDRGQTENWIKDLKLACLADRLSCHRFLANQVRLLLYAAAYTLLHRLRTWLVRAGSAPLTLETLRLRLL